MTEKPRIIFYSAAHALVMTAVITAFLWRSLPLWAIPVTAIVFFTIAYALFSTVWPLAPKRAVRIHATRQRYPRRTR